MTPSLILLAGTSAFLATALFVLAHRLRAAERLRIEREKEHRTTMDRLQESENRLRAIIEHEPECVKLQAADGTVLDVNPAGMRLIDCERREDLIGQSIYTTVAPEFHALYREQMRRVFTGESVVFEFRAIGLKGRECWLETHAVPLPDAHGRIHALLGVTRDVTNQKNIEEQTRRHQFELARVARLSSMGEMATGIAHELNQPLAAIANFARGCVRRLQNGDADPREMAESLEEIVTQADRAAEVIRHVRDFTRKADPQPACVDANALVSNLKRFIELEIRLLDARLVLDLAPGLPPIEVDSIMIEQAICNLVRNAAEAMEETPCRDRVVKVRTRQDTRGGIEIAVIDRGPGVPAEIVDRIFDQFFTTKPDGVGIGLALSRSCIEAHGGTIRVENGAAGGAVFRIQLPVARVAIQAA